MGVYFARSDEEYDHLSQTLERGQVIVRNAEEFQQYFATQGAGLARLFDRDAVRGAGQRLEFAAHDTLLPGYYKILQVTQEPARPGIPGDLPWRFIGKSLWKSRAEDDFFPESEVKIRLNPLLNKVSRSNFMTEVSRRQGPGTWPEKRLENFKIISKLIVHIHDIELREDPKYPGSRSYAVDWSWVADNSD